ALLKSIRKHVDDLSGKNYHALYREKSPDFVLLFMPIEPAYLLALQSDWQLWEEAYQKRVLLTSPSTLHAILKVVATLWRQESQNKNALEIAKHAGELYDKFVGFLEDLQKVGDKIKGANLVYEELVQKLITGKGSLVAKVEKIRTLGAQNLKKLPDIFNSTD
ncbi:MAG: DNA recombination protein RmuC, partial [Flammeovirgaceae bacterium]|nr:DNA recombination protein RmuC [Flammeovirgaceae bacterium]MDW8288841.1 DNA recombination protein RmuC [Flammeovirgaceae bacterium]